MAETGGRRLNDNSYMTNEVVSVLTLADISRLNYILGRMEGIAAGSPDCIMTALLDTCELLLEFIDEKKGKL